MAEGRWQIAAAVGGAAMLYVVSALAAGLLSREAGGVAVYWPANALISCLALRLPRPLAWATLSGGLIGSFAAQLEHSVVGATPLIAGGNAIETVLLFLLLRPVVSQPRLLRSPLGLGMQVLTPALAAAVGGTVGALGTAELHQTTYLAAWSAWLVGNALSFVLTATPILLVDREALADAGPPTLARLGEAALALTLIAVTVAGVMADGRYGFTSVLMPGLLWLALRFGLALTALTSTATGVFVMIAVAEGWWPLPDEGASGHSVLAFKLALSLSLLSPLFVAAASQERRRAVRTLGEAVELMPDSFAVFDADGRLRLANARFEQFLPGLGRMMRPGVRLSELLRTAARRGVFAPAEVGGDVDRFVRQQCDLLWRDGASFELELADGRHFELTARRTGDGGIVAVHRDVTERSLRLRAVEHAARHDPLTGVANRAELDRELRRRCERTAVRGGRFALILLDLDRFKPVNDTHGHAVGDRVLCTVAERLRQAVRAGDLVARAGGDEFVVIADLDGSQAGPSALVERATASIQAPILLDGVALGVGASLGIAVCPEDGSSPADLLLRADRALYATKATRPGRAPGSSTPQPA